MGRQLLVLGCSQAKRSTTASLPAIELYDGSPYRVLRSFLRHHDWPSNLSVAVLSAKHGLFGGLKGIHGYDLRMTQALAASQTEQCCETLRSWADSHDSVSFSLGKDYLPAVGPAIEELGSKAQVFHGQIGEKLHQIKELLHNTATTPRCQVQLEAGSGKLSYFLPDWDDLLDPSFDFDADSFSASSRTQRVDQHCCVLMQPSRMCDGVLVSLAQHTTSKGPLRRLNGTELGALAPTPLRSAFGLASDQWLFGDCGAFSYVNDPEPAINVEQALAMYDLYGFDFGASVDHIPVPFVEEDGTKRALDPTEQQARVAITQQNAALFIEGARRRKSNFVPVGTIQALTADGYADCLSLYHSLGYRHVAVGGLVPKTDSEILDIVTRVMSRAASLRPRPWVHLFGVFRPKLKQQFRELKVDSFDSATYFRKAWLRSDQNYLGVDGTWYAALRVPMTSDGRTRKKLIASESDITKLEAEERQVLSLLARFDRDEATVDEVLDCLLEYDRHLTRSSEASSMRLKYRRTLEERPWRRCNCPFCKSIGIHVAIFRGANRNKRRGAHNTLMLYRSLGPR